MKCILVYVGLPACGKTLLAGKLCSYLSSRQFKVKIFSFDDLCSLEKQAQIANQSSADSFRHFRYVMKTEVNAFLAAPNPENERRLAIVDDNNYYRSMRYEYYQLAANWLAGFLQIFVQCEVSLALSRNSLRLTNFRVPDEVIIQMETKLEIPSEPWENTLVVRQAELENSNLLRAMEERIEESFSNPVKMYEILSEKEAEALKSKTINDRSLLHNIDKILRRFVSKKLQERDKEVDPRVLAKHLTENRHEFMGRIRNGKISLPREFAKAGKESLLEKWLETSFDNFG